MAGTIYKKVEGIKVNGSNRYAGGQIYNAAFTMSFNEKPLEITINVVSKDGKYSPPSLKLDSAVTISIGKLSLGSMYPYSVKESFSTTNGKTLEIKLIDSSFVLDKVWIGIPGKHGVFNYQLDNLNNRFKEYYDKNKGYTDILDSKNFVNTDKQNIAEMVKDGDKESSLFLIGRYFHPCDVDKNNQISPKEEKNIDPCDPCPYCPQDKYESKCFELGETKLFEAGYSFKDLIDNWDKIKFPNGVTVTIRAPEIKLKPRESKDDPYEKYYRDYHGPLREVLTNWASDFGMTWFYDIEKTEIKFIDFNSKELEIKPDDILNEYKVDQLISYELEESAENTTQVGCISWYEREGERKNFDCSQSQAITLGPLFGADLIGNKLRSAQTAKGEKNLSVEEDTIGAIYGAYYPGLREAYWLRDIYEITDVNTAAEMITQLNLETGLKDDGTPKQKKAMPELGDMAILAVAGRGLAKSAKEKTPFQKLVNYKLNELENSLTDSERGLYFQNTGFFIVAYQNEEYLERTLKVEGELFNFIGRFHVRENLFRLCGITGSEEFVRNNTSIETADGSAQIYSKREGLDSSPLAQFNALKKGYLGCITSTGNLLDSSNFFKDLYKDEESSQSYKVQGLTFQTAKSKDYLQGIYLDDTIKTKYRDHDSPHLSDKGNTIPIKMSQSVIILDRQAQWIPRPDDFEDYRRILANSNFSLLTLKEMGNEGQITTSDWTKAAFGQETEAQVGALKSGLAGKIKIFLTYPGNFTAEISRNKPHPVDKDIYEKKDYEKISRRIGGRYGSLTKIGLLDSKCAEIVTNINGEKKIIPKIYTPPLTLGKQKGNGKKFINDDWDPIKQPNKPCDNVLTKSEDLENRTPSYKVILSQNFNQTVVLPKIQSGVHSGIKAPDEVMSFNINYNSITNDEFIAFTGYTGYGCIPNLSYLKNINDVYSLYAISNITPDKSVKLEIKALPRFKDYESEVKKGLDSFNLNLSEQGVNCSLYYSTKAAKKISQDIMKWKNTIRFNAIPRGH